MAPDRTPCGSGGGDEVIGVVGVGVVVAVDGSGPGLLQRSAGSSDTSDPEFAR